MAKQSDIFPFENVEDINANLKSDEVTAAKNWDQRLGFLMHDVSRLRRIVFDGYMKPIGITRSQWWILAYLSRDDGMIQTDLALMLDIGKAALGGLVDRLETAGLIERRSDNDRRAKRVYLSEKGRQTVAEMAGKSAEMSELILDGLNHDERVQLTQALTRIKRNLVAIKGGVNQPSDVSSGDG